MKAGPRSAVRAVYRKKIPMKARPHSAVRAVGPRSTVVCCKKIPAENSDKKKFPVNSGNHTEILNSGNPREVVKSEIPSKKMHNPTNPGEWLAKCGETCTHCLCRFAQNPIWQKKKIQEKSRICHCSIIQRKFRKWPPKSVIPTKKHPFQTRGGRYGGTMGVQVPLHLTTVLKKKNQEEGGVM